MRYSCLELLDWPPRVELAAGENAELILFMLKMADVRLEDGTKFLYLALISRPTTLALIVCYNGFSSSLKPNTGVLSID